MAKTKQKRSGRPPSDTKLEIQIFTRIDAGTNGRLEAAGVKMDRSPSWILRKGLEEWLDRNGFRRDPAGK